MVISTVSSLPSQLSLASAVLGVTSHWAYFIHGDRNTQSFVFFIVLIVGPAALAAALHGVAGVALMQALAVAAVSTGSYLAGLFASIVVYRLWLHPAAHFPGPFPARVTQLFYPYTYMRCNGQYYRLQKAWFDTYGDVVRTGPNEVIVADPSVLPHLAKAAKGAWYSIGQSNPSVHSVRDVRTHSIRRRVWDRAFTPAAIAGCVATVQRYRERLLQALASGERGETNITACVSHFAFDTMGRLTYGRDFGMLEKQGRDGSDYFLRMTHASMRVVGLLGHVPWLLVLLERLGAAGKDHMRFLKWCDEMTEERRRRGMVGGVRDLFQVLLEAEDGNKHPHHVPLRGDSRTAIVAGSDTTASTLITLFTYLADSPEALKELQQDLDSIPEDSTDSRLLNACIDEALRLNPPVPSGVSRTSPPEGITLDNGTFIPGGIDVLFPLWASSHDPRWFDSPDEFRPHRWLDSSPEELAKMKAVFHPFWLGRYGCAGKPLAMVQLRDVAAAVVRRFEFSLVGSVEEAFDRCVDTFTVEMGEVRCVFKGRERA